MAEGTRETLDEQDCIWSPDTIGNLLADPVIRAAVRGVGVKLGKDRRVKSQTEVNGRTVT